MLPTAGAPGIAEAELVLYVPPPELLVERTRRNSWLSVGSCGWTDTADSDGGRWWRTMRDDDDGRGGRRGERREARDLISDRMDLKEEE
jgi:hypothetical protein